MKWERWICIIINMIGKIERNWAEIVRTHQWTKTANAWQQCCFVYRALLFTLATWTNVSGNHVFNRWILLRVLKKMFIFLPNFRFDAIETNFSIPYLLQWRQEHIVHWMCIDGDGTFRTLFRQHWIHFRFQCASWTKQLHRPVTHLILQRLHWFRIIDGIVFIGFNIDRCQMTVVNEFFAILTLPTVVLNEFGWLINTQHTTHHRFRLVWTYLWQKVFLTRFPKVLFDQFNIDIGIFRPNENVCHSTDHWINLWNTKINFQINTNRMNSIFSSFTYLGFYFHSLGILIEQLDSGTIP